MKRFAAVGLTFAVVAVGAVTVSAQGPPMPQPAPEHALLKQDVGEWHAVVKMWMGPGDPVQSEGTETVSMVGPFWQVSKFEGSMMGQKFEGTGWTGWDARQKRYVTAWIDSMTPVISHGSATWNAETKTLSGTMDGINPDGSKATMETTVVYTEGGERVMTMKMGGQPMMEITYTRK
jgi:hypothetical protein